MPTLINPHAFRPGTMLSAIQRLGLTTNLKLCLDASDVNSYSGAGQSWLDTSGNGYDFFRGTTSSSQSSDPTFNGTAGGQSSSEYWSFDGADHFTYDSSNETWMNNLHKNNAILTIAAWVYFADFDDTNPIFSTTQSTGEVGCTLFSTTSTGEINFAVAKAVGGNLAYSSNSNLNADADEWCFVAVSLNEATGSGGSIVQLNGSQTTGDSTYSSPSSSSATNTLRLASGEGGVDSIFFQSGSRLAAVVAWEGTALTAQNLTDLYNLTKGKFGL